MDDTHQPRPTPTPAGRLLHIILATIPLVLEGCGGDATVAETPNGPPSERAAAAADETGAGSGLAADEAVATAATVPAEAATTVVATVSALKAALAVAEPGSVVYVADSAALDLTGTVGLSIPRGVTLASGRGQGSAAGALLFTTQLETLPLLIAGGPDVRVTGLRIRGPDTAIGTSPYGQPLARGIQAIGVSGLQVDHCELSGWSHAAIYLDRSINGAVHHNSIHHNRRTGLGYGVCLHHGSTALIERNTFDANRHAIAGTGIRDISYHARYNLVGPTRNGHAFDMHGEDEALDNGAPYAGDLIRIHHNTFQGADAQGVVIRGRPATGAYISDNCFASGASLAIIQRYFTGNLFASENLFGQTAGKCHLAAGPTPGDVDGDGRADLVTAHTNGSAYVYGGTATGGFGSARASFGQTLHSALGGAPGHHLVGVADVTGDGRSDLVSAHDNGNAYVWPGDGTLGFGSAVSSFAGTLRLAVGDVQGHDPVALGDVTGDGRADLITLHSSGVVYVFPGAEEGRFGGAVASLTGFDSGLRDGVGHWPVAAEDVDGDGHADLVTVHSGGSAYVFRGTSTGALELGVASFAGTLTLATVAGQGHLPVGVADVDGDGRGDLVTLHSSGTAYVYRGAASATFGASTASFAGTMKSAQFGGPGHQVVGAPDFVWRRPTNFAPTRACSCGSQITSGDPLAGVVRRPVIRRAADRHPPPLSPRNRLDLRSLATQRSGAADSRGRTNSGALDVTGDGRADLLTLFKGSAYVYPGLSTGGFGHGVASFAGTLASSFSGGAGHETIELGPIARRLSCPSASGCRAR